MYNNESLHRRIKCASKKIALPLIAAFFFFTACEKGNRAVLWTERPEFAIYTEVYNASQQRYTVEVRFVSNAAEQLATQWNVPDIIIGNYLNSPAVLPSLEKIDYLFSKYLIDKDLFYPELLRPGLQDKYRCLIPVSFNLPAIFFKNDPAKQLTNNLFIELDELKTLSAEYNRNERGNWLRKGFSPIWGADDDFIFITARLFNSGFVEEKLNAGKKNYALNWNYNNLNSSIQYLNDWINTNGGFQSEEDFIYKYFFNPELKLISEGRIRFACKDSDDYFTMPEDALGAELDFRWISSGGKLPVNEDALFFGIHKKSRAKNAASDFAVWFFNVETQEQLLRLSRDNHLYETVFGIAGGFSTLQSVNESVFPKYYNALRGHIPQPGDLSAAAPLPPAWREIKRNVIIPYILENVLSRDGTGRTLEERLDDWQQLKRGTFR
jgi:hypothetical protein